MGRNVLIELLYTVTGLMAAWAIFAAAAWAYPLGRDVIWWCGAIAMIATVLMGLGPIRRAAARDRGQA